MPRGNGDVVEQAEAHRPVGEGMVAGRADEREAPALRRRDRRARREQRGLERRLRRRRVRVEPRELVDRADSVDVPGGVAAQDGLLPRRLRFHEVERVEERSQPRLRFGMLPGRVQLRERGVAQYVDRIAAASSSSERLPCARPAR